VRSTKRFEIAYSSNAKAFRSLFEDSERAAMPPRHDGGFVDVIGVRSSGGRRHGPRKRLFTAQDLADHRQAQLIRTISARTSLLILGPAAPRRAPCGSKR
jgi:hypothetical protein